MDTGNQKDISDIKDSSPFAFITDKMKKLTAALYRVTDLYSNREPIKWSLRESALELNNKINLLLGQKKSVWAANLNLSVIFEEASVLFLRIMDMLDIAGSESFTSNINLEILKKEYSSLYSFLMGEKDKIIESQKFLISPAEDLFKQIEKPAEKKPELKPKPETEPKGHIGHKGQIEVKYIGNIKRQEKIIEFLRTDGKKTVKEIAAIFEGFSEKTIQRDILDLVRAGKLAAEGEKRWRVYSIS